jgi:hypothetical protein
MNNKHHAASFEVFTAVRLKTDAVTGKEIRSFEGFYFLRLGKFRNPAVPQRCISQTAPRLLSVLLYKSKNSAQPNYLWPVLPTYHRLHCVWTARTNWMSERVSLYISSEVYPTFRRNMLPSSSGLVYRQFPGYVSCDLSRVRHSKHFY